MKTTSEGNGSVPRHLEDVDLISYLDGELERAEQDYARTHLEGCWNCRSHLLAVQNSIESFLRARKQVMPPEVPPADAAVGKFRRRLSEHASAPVSARLGLRLGQWLRSFVPDFTLLQTYRKTALASALVLVALTFVLLDPLKWNAVSADELLSRADAHEFLNERPQGKVVRQRARFVRINQTTKAETDLGQVETDADNLSAAVYVSVESRSRGAQRQTLPDRDKSSANFFREDFQFETSAYLRTQGWLPQVSTSLYQRLIAGRGRPANEGAIVSRHGNFYELHHPFVAGHQSHISEAVLTLNAENYAPHSISIVTVENGERLEYRLTRTSIEAIERTPDVAKLFESSANDVALIGKSDARHPTPDPLVSTPNTLPPTPVAASADLEVEVLRLLHQAGADLGEQVNVSREANGPVRVTGIVDSEQRKNEILRALQTVAGNPAVSIDVKTVAEAMAERRDKRDPSRVTTVEGVEVAADTFPAYQDLRARMSDEEARVFAARMVSRSHSAMRHAWALKRLLSQFSASDLAKLQPEAHAKWIALIKSHARAFENESRNLRSQLEPIFGAGGAGGSSAGPITDDASLMRAVERLVALAGTNYEVVRSAFTVTRAPSQFSAIKSPQFWQSLRSAEAVAASIARAP